jgi:hypothetical protein
VSKYQSLSNFLIKQNITEIPMTFSEVEHVISAKLPPSAYRHRPWWANDAANHVHAKAWLDAGYETAQVDMAGKKLVFKRTRFVAAPSNGGLAEPQREFKHEAGASQPRRHPMFGAMKGLITIEPGYDLAQPAMPEWAEMLDKKYGTETRK